MRNIQWLGAFSMCLLMTGSIWARSIEPVTDLRTSGKIIRPEGLIPGYYYLGHDVYYPVSSFDLYYGNEWDTYYMIDSSYFSEMDLYGFYNPQHCFAARTFHDKSGVIYDLTYINHTIISENITIEPTSPIVLDVGEEMNFIAGGEVYIKPGEEFYAPVGSKMVIDNCECNTSAVAQDEFKIGVMADLGYFGTNFWDPNIYGPGGTNPNVNAIDNNGHFSSTLNVLGSHGVNAVHSYVVDHDGAGPMALTLLRKNGMVYLGNFKEYYKPNATVLGPTDPENYALNGSNLYTGETHLGKWRTNYDGIIQNLYPSFKDVVWGVQTNEEAAYCHACLWNVNGTDEWMNDDDYSSNNPHGGGALCGNFNNAFYATEYPPAKVDEARQHFKTMFNTYDLDVKLISMEAPHGYKLNSAPTGAVEHGKNGRHAITPLSFVSILGNDGKDVFFEGSIVEFPFQTGSHLEDNMLTENNSNGFSSWNKETFNDGGKTHYLNRFESLNWANNYTSHTHTVIPVHSGNAASRFFNSRPYSSTTYPEPDNHQDHYHSTGDYLWFQAYNSIVHRVEGVWFYAPLDSYRPDESHQSADLAPNHFQESYFPEFYLNYTRNLIKELAYLKNNGFLLADNSNILAERTNETQPSNEPIDMTTDFDAAIPDPDFSYEDRETFYTLHQSNLNFRPRYTMRTNGDDVILIVTNQMPIAIKCAMDFGCFNNEIIQNSDGVEVLFSNENWITEANAGMSTHISYKYNRDSGIDLGQNTVGTSMYMGFSNGKLLSFVMGPLDVMVFKFHKSTALTAGLNNGWDEIWTNHKDKNLGGTWTIKYDDKYYTGDFDGDGLKNDVLCVGSGLNYWITWSHFDGTGWSIKWSNWGNQSHVLTPYRHSLYVGDFDGDGRDDLFSNYGGQALFNFNPFANNNVGDFERIWMNYGSNNIQNYMDQVIVGNFDGGNQDCLIGYDNPNGDIIMWCYTAGNFMNGWSYSTSPSQSEHPLETFRNTYSNTKTVVGDFTDDGNPKEEILGFDQWGARVYRFEPLSGGGFDFKGVTPWIDNHIQNWYLPLSYYDFALADNVDQADSRDELILIGPTGYFATFTLRPDHLDWDILWWGTPSAPYIDNFYIPKSAFSNYFSTIDHTNGQPAGLLAIKRDCIGHAGIYGSTTYAKSMEANSPESENEQYNSDGDMNIIIYPNPTTGKCMIQLSGEVTGDIEIFNLLGTKIYSIRPIENQPIYEFDLANYASGIYLVNLTVNGERITKKLILQ